MENIHYAYEVEPKNSATNISVVRVVNNNDCQLIEFSDGTLVGNVDKADLLYTGNGFEVLLQPGICIESIKK